MKTKNGTVFLSSFTNFDQNFSINIQSVNKWVDETTDDMCQLQNRVPKEQSVIIESTEWKFMEIVYKLPLNCLCLAGTTFSDGA